MERPTDRPTDGWKAARSLGFADRIQSTATVILFGALNFSLHPSTATRRVVPCRAASFQCEKSLFMTLEKNYSDTYQTTSAKQTSPEGSRRLDEDLTMLVGVFTRVHPSIHRVSLFIGVLHGRAAEKSFITELNTVSSGSARVPHAAPAISLKPSPRRRAAAPPRRRAGTRKARCSSSSGCSYTVCLCMSST